MRLEVRRRSRSAWRFWRRVTYPVALGAVAAYMIPHADRRVVAYKVGVVVAGWVLWHVLRKQTFPELDFQECMRGGGPRAVAAAIFMAASCLAVVLGLALSF